MMRRWCARCALMVVGSWLLAGCEIETVTTPPPPLPECIGTGTVTVVADTGMIPVFSWTPNCTVGRLIVEEGVEERWGTETLGENIYQSPITYGVAPPGASKDEPGDPLQPGTTYRVTVFRWVTFLPESLDVLGSYDFTP